MKTLLIVNVGLPTEAQYRKFGCFEQWAKNAIADKADNIAFHDGINQPLPAYDTLAGVIIMGSLSMVTEELPWMRRLAQQIVELTQRHIPVLGICFGHQLVAYALGGKVDYHPQGLEIGSVAITRTPQSNDDPLFSGLDTPFYAQAVHYQSVLTLPPAALLLAASEFDPHHAFRVGQSTWGVQFHPEFTTEHIQASIDGLKEALGETPKHNHHNEHD